VCFADGVGSARGQAAVTASSSTFGDSAAFDTTCAFLCLAFAALLLPLFFFCLHGVALVRAHRALSRSLSLERRIAAQRSAGVLTPAGPRTPAHTHTHTHTHTLSALPPSPCGTPVSCLACLHVCTHACHPPAAAPTRLAVFVYLLGRHRLTGTCVRRRRRGQVGPRSLLSYCHSSSLALSQTHTHTLSLPGAYTRDHAHTHTHTASGSVYRPTSAPAPAPALAAAAAQTPGRQPAAVE